MLQYVYMAQCVKICIYVTICESMWMLKYANVSKYVIICKSMQICYNM